MVHGRCFRSSLSLKTCDIFLDSGFRFQSEFVVFFKMRLGIVLQAFRREFIGPIPKHKGNVLKGKKRFVPPVTLGKKISLVNELLYEEETMKYLSKSFVTEAQEVRYLDSKNLSHPPYWDDFTRQSIQEPMPQTYCADFLEKLNVSRSFEEED